MSRTYTVQGFILKRINYCEADKIITIFTREKGKQVLLAKGIRKICSRRAGCLELFNHTKMMVAKGKGMDIVCDTQLDCCYPAFSQDYHKTQIAYQIIELVDKMTREEQREEEVYDLLHKAFQYLQKTKLDKAKKNKVLLRFKLRLLDILGFGYPEQINLPSLKLYIEDIIERKLVASKSFAMD
ncbi:DNA repair protein RecO [Candidatus Beckwithbacteria bacterium]|nr:DNA repair protein RecO [Candidatus Beckwithbacteria bacterium]